MPKGRFKVFTDEEAKLRKWVSLKLYYEKNKEAIIEKQKQNYKENIEERCTNQKKFYIENREKLLENQKKYYNNNIEKKRAYYQANKEIIKAKRDAKKASAKEK